MKIPVGFYIQYWLKNSILALATGVIVVFFIPPLFAFSPLVCLTGLLIYQVIIFRYFWGDRKGDFEYKYREITIEKTIKKIIIKTHGKIEFLRYYMEQFSQIGTFQEGLFKELLRNKDIQDNEDFEFTIYVKAANISPKNYNYDNQIKYLQKAIDIKPNDMVANYRMAVSFERIGAGNDAIKYYENALRDPCIKSDQLKEFILLQISRITAEGPKKKPPILGLRYLTW